ncbi:MAG: CPBP family intramembrane metalloprotease, partial [Euryarchaeota archaeon]|nr:CPBP family intramembrane metalloprotease [Euryarchaeota archaeon]
LSNFLVMIYSIGYVQGFIGDKYFAIPFYILVPVPLLFAYLEGVAAYIWYLFLAVCITASLTLFLFYGLREYVNKLLSKPLSYKSTSLQEFSELFALVLFLAVLVTFIMRLMGISTEGIGLDKIPLYAQMLALLHASVYEELVTRLVFVGVPVYLWRSIERRRRGERGISPIHILGGGYKIGGVEIFFILLSATIFGVAHTPAWGWWKFVPAFIAGVAMAYLYLRYGIHYSIMFHFATDFMIIGMSMSKVDMFFMSGVYIILIVLGIVFTVSYAIKIMQFFRVMPKEKEGAKQKNEPPAPWIDARCPSCGSQHFRYLDDGRLQCLNCGTTFEYGYQEQSLQSAPESQEIPPPP